MTLAAVLCCAMTTAVFTACSNNDDNPTIPSADVNKGIVINLGSMVIKPYLQFGASLADVENYMKGYYADWIDNNPNALNEFQQQEGTTWKKTHTKGNQTINYLFGSSSGGKLLLCSYGGKSSLSLADATAELERNGFKKEGVLKFDDYDADVCYLFLSADKSIEVQLSYWQKDGGRWSISFQEFDEYDMQFLEPINKGVVINLGSIVIKPYLQFGALQADVEAYMQENFADWTCTKSDQQERSFFPIRYRKDNRIIVFAFDNALVGSLRMATYGFENSEMSFPAIKAELERNGFIYQGKLNYHDIPDIADVYQMFLSADKSLEVQFVRWEQSNKWALGFQTFDENDLNYLETENK